MLAASCLLQRAFLDFELIAWDGGVRSRLWANFAGASFEGLRDRRLGKVSPHRTPACELERMHALYRERYSDFTVKPMIRFQATSTNRKCCASFNL
jgi:hypothetical protein